MYESVLAVSAFLLFFVILVALVGQLRRKWRVMASDIPHLKGPPILGNLLHIVKIFNLAPGIPHAVYIIENIKGLYELLGRPGVMAGTFGSMYYVAVVSADSVEELLSSNKELNKTPEYKYVEDWLGTGLITCAVDKWRKQRKLLTPAFHFKILNQFHSTMITKTEILVNKLRRQIGKPFVSIEPYISNCTLDIIAETALGVSVDAQKQGSSPFSEAIHKVSSLLFRRIASPWLWFSPFFYLSPTGREFAKYYKVVSDFVKQTIRDKKKAMDESDASDLDYTENSSTRRAFLEMLLLHNLQNKNNQLSEKDIEDEVHTFAFAGHDTTTTTLTWTMYLLGLYPHIQDKVVEELNAVLGDDPQKSVSLEDIKQMQYLERVIKESQRLYPPIPYIARKIQEDIQLGGHVIPKASTVVVVLTLLHNDPKQFPEPHLFDPDRFLQPVRHPFAYVPFSAGPRNCIGQRFAVLEMKTILCILLRNFRLISLDPRDKVLNCSEIVNRPHGPVRIRFEERSSTVQ